MKPDHLPLAAVRTLEMPLAVADLPGRKTVQHLLHGSVLIPTEEALDETETMELRGVSTAGLDGMGIGKLDAPIGRVGHDQGGGGIEQAGDEIALTLQLLGLMRQLFHLAARKCVQAF